MNDLITAAIEIQDLQALVDFPTELMNDFEGEIVTWIASYVRRYSTFPTLTRVEKQFPDFVPLFVEEPIQDIFDQAVTEKKRVATASSVALIAEKLREPDYDPTPDISELNSVLSTSGSGLIKYSKFDREAYWRPITPLLFRFPRIDKVTGGLINGDLCYIVGRLGTGKSTTAQWLTHNWWKDGKKILFVSNETLPIDVLMRLDAMAGKFDPLELRLRVSSKTLKSKVKVVSAMASAADGEVILPRRRISTPSSVIGMANQLEVDAVIVDGVYLMRTDRYIPAKWERIAEISNQLKQGALELGIPVVGLSQIKRIGNKATLEPEDIAYSDALGQDADIVLGITPQEEKGRVSLEMIKNRFGDMETLGTTLKIDFKTMTVSDVGVAT